MNTFKPIPYAKGALESPLQKHEVSAKVDIELYTLLEQELGWLDWTYLAIVEGHKLEVVKVVRLLGSQQIEMVRGVEYTCPENFLFANLRYIETEAELIYKLPHDMLSVTGTGAIKVEGNTVEYPALQFVSLGGTIAVGSSKITIGTVKLAVCCGGQETTPISNKYLPLRITSEKEYRSIDTDELRSTSE